MNRPRDGENPMAQVNVRIPVWVRRALEEEARRQRRTLSDMARIILTEHFAKVANGEKG